jgi:peptide/nickel transport system substrate-binding protein
MLAPDSSPHPLLGDAGVRRALTMGTDRAALVANTFGTLAYVAHGPMFRDQFTFDSTIAQIPFDLAGAKRMLDSLGWLDDDADGVRTKGGVPLALTIVAAHGPSEHIAVLLQGEWNKLGVRTTVIAIAKEDMGLRVGKKHEFDVTVMKVSTSPSVAAILGSWGSRAGLNVGRYRSAVFDALVDTARQSATEGLARRNMRRAYEQILRDAPAIFLWEAKGALAVSHRINVPAPIGNNWWIDLADWSISSPKS